MARHDVIVIGASAGGVQALQQLTSGLPPDFPGSLFVAMHLSAWHKSSLADILHRTGPLPASFVDWGQSFEPGHIYIAPPDRHLLVENGRVEPWHGPKENRHRPAINPLFRSAAVNYGERVVGIILTGCLDDGSAGLWLVKRYGGVTIVQDPERAQYPEMPRAALEYVDVDHVLDLPEIPMLLSELVEGNEREDFGRSVKKVRKWKPNGA